MIEMDKSRLSNYDDPLIYRKKKLVDENVSITKNGFPLPAVIEVSESGMCNRKCVFCPRSDPDYEHVNEFISSDLIERLTSELKEIKYQNLFLFSGFVEPLLDKNIYNLLKIVRKNLTQSRIEIITNGDVLNKERAIKLFNSGLSCLLISIYDGKEAEEKIYDLMQSCNLREDQYKIRKRYLSESENFGISLSNRGGMMKNAEYSIPNPKKSLRRPCYYPNYTFFMNYTGEVLVCNHDWGKKFVVGNFKERSFKDLWLDKKWIEARQKLYEGKRNFSPCNVCDVDGLRMGSNHAIAWKKYLNKK